MTAAGRRPAALHVDVKVTLHVHVHVQTPDKTNFRGALRYAPLQIFGPTLRSYANFRRARAARAKEKLAVKSVYTRESGLSGADRNSQKNDLLLACFWPRPNVVSRAARIIDLCLSPAHATEYGRRPVQHCCECARSARPKKFSRFVTRGTADFRRPVTPCQQIFALRYETLFCPGLYTCGTDMAREPKPASPLGHVSCV